MRIPKAEMMSYNDHVVGFTGERVGTKGYIELYTTFDKEKSSKIIKIQYLVIDANTSYNILMGRPSINRLRAIVSTLYLAMKFPSLSGDILTVHVDQKHAWSVTSKALGWNRCSTTGPQSANPLGDESLLIEKLSLHRWIRWLLWWI